MEIKDSDIIIFSLSRHDSFISSPSFSLAKEFAKNNRVFYIDHPYSFKDVITDWALLRRLRKLKILFGGNRFKSIPGYGDRLIAITPPMTLPVNFLPVGKIHRVLSRYNDNLLFETIRKVIRKYRVEKYIYLNAFDPYFGVYFPSDLSPVLKIYQSMDDLSQVTYTAKHGIKLEREIMNLYDHTFVTSRQLYRLHEPYARKIHYHPNAVDSQLFTVMFNEVDMPDDLKGIKAPMIGFTGAIDYRTDYDLLRNIARSHRDKSVVLIGPITDNEPIESGIMNEENVVFLGAKKIEELASYLKHFSCVLIPYKCNVLTSSIYPLKVNEYLAAGKPTIATNFSEDIKEFGGVVYLADSHEQFISQIDRAISEDSTVLQAARVAISKQNTWTVRVNQFWDMISN